MYWLLKVYFDIKISFSIIDNGDLVLFYTTQIIPLTIIHNLFVIVLLLNLVLNHNNSFKNQENAIHNNMSQNIHLRHILTWYKVITSKALLTLVYKVLY